MIKTNNERYDDIVRNYIFAKDNNKPYLMKKAFTESANLEMVVKTENISFPSNAIGLDAITDILVRKFNQNYENVYTFCISDSIKEDKDELFCNWLVGMTEKEGGSIRVGCGGYNWHFDNSTTILADRLIITIEQMVVLEASFSAEIIDWVSKLPYPWCASAAMFKDMPNIEPLNSIQKITQQ